MTRIRTSMQSTPSGVTDHEANENRDAIERRAWLNEGIVLIGVHDQSINPAVRAIAEGFGIGKFKCRPGKSAVCDRGDI